METTVYPRSGSDRDSAVTAPALAAPLAPADAPPEADAGPVEPLLAPAVLRGGIVPPPFGLLDEHPARASEAASAPAPRALATRRRPDRPTRERVTREHLHDQAEHNPPAQQQPHDSTRHITTTSRTTAPPAASTSTSRLTRSRRCNIPQRRPAAVRAQSSHARECTTVWPPRHWVGLSPSPADPGSPG